MMCFTLATWLSANHVLAADIALFVNNPNPLNTGDQALFDLLEEFGHSVEAFGHDLFPDEQLDIADQNDLVIVSESVTSGNIGSNLNESATAIIVYEPFVFDDMGLTGSGGSTTAGAGGPPDFDYGFTTPDETELRIADPNHPMAAGLSDFVEIYFDFAIVGWGVPTEDASVIARPVGEEGAESAAIFVYQEGDEMFNGPSPGVRIGYFLHNRTAEPSLLTEDGISLVQAAVDFALNPSVGPTEPVLQAGDANQDLSFDQLDIVQVSIAAKYLTGQAATWGEGDWDGAPGGRPGEPPDGNGLFDQIDIVTALSGGTYLTGPYFPALTTNGTLNDEQTTLVYDANTGELTVDAPASTQLTSIFVTSASNQFIGDKPPVLDGPFDSFGPDNIFKSTIGASFGDSTFGNVLPAGLTEEQVAADLSASGSLAGGGGLGNVDLVYIPEPAAIVGLFFGLLISGMVHRRD